MRKNWLLGTVVLAASLVILLAGCGNKAGITKTGSSVPVSNSAQTGAAKTTTANIPVKKDVTIQVITDQTNGQPKMVPAFVPANLTLPENEDVTVTVINHDDGGATLLAKDGNQVKGTLNGTMTVDGKTVTSVPADKVAHTITIAATGNFKGLNVPIEAHASSEKNNTIVFTFHTPSTPAKLNWKCMTACGDGSGGMGGVMSWGMNPGYMSGTWTVQ